MGMLTGKSNNRRSARASTATQCSMAVRYLVVGSVLAFSTLPAIVLAQPPCPGIYVNIPNVKNSSFLGAPTEGFGFSSGAEAAMSAPSPA